MKTITKEEQEKIDQSLLTAHIDHDSLYDDPDPDEPWWNKI